MSTVSNIVSIANALIEAYCQKYPDEYCYDDHCLGYTESGEILDAQGGSPDDTFEWILTEIIPDLTQSGTLLE